MSKGHLYLIPVPIADAEAGEFLYPGLDKVVNLLNEFVVEDLRSARKALRKIGFKGDFDQVKFHLLNEHTKQQEISDMLEPARRGNSIGLLSEAGTPAVADPGSELVNIAHEEGLRVIPLAGPNAMVLALAASGLNGQQFSFHGYLPKDQKSRIRKIRELESEALSSGYSQIFIETPYRNAHVIADVISSCQDRTKFCIAADINGATEFVLTQPILKWKSATLPDLKKRPAVFLIGQ